MTNPNTWNLFNQSTYEMNGKTYRNLEAQVAWNKQQIENMNLEELNALPERVDALEAELIPLKPIPKKVDDLEQYTSAIGEHVTELEGTVNSFAAIQTQTYLYSPQWSSVDKTYTLTLPGVGITATNIVAVAPDPISLSDYIDAGIVCISQDLDTLTFKCDKVPNVSVRVNIITVKPKEVQA